MYICRSRSFVVVYKTVAMDLRVLFFSPIGDQAGAVILGLLNFKNPVDGGPGRGYEL